MAPHAGFLNPTDQERDALGGNLEQDISRHILSTLGDDPSRQSMYSCFTGLAFSIKTHPAIAVPEPMRFPMDEESLSGWLHLLDLFRR